MPTAKKETNTAKGTAKTAKSISAAVNRSQNPAAGHTSQGVNGQPEELLVLMEGGSLHWVARAG